MKALLLTSLLILLTSQSLFERVKNFERSRSTKQPQVVRRTQQEEEETELTNEEETFEAELEAQEAAGQDPIGVDSPSEPQVLCSSEQEQAGETAYDSILNKNVRADTKLYFSNFQRLYFGGKFVNKVYNHVARVAPSLEAEAGQADNPFQDAPKPQNFYQQTRRFVLEPRTQSAEFGEELEQLFTHIDQVQMPVEEALDFYGFSDYYRAIATTKNVGQPVFMALQKLLVAQVDSFALAMRDFVASVRELRRIDLFLQREFEPLAEHLGAEDRMTDVEKSTLGNQLMLQIFAIKAKFEAMLGKVAEGALQVQEIRTRLVVMLNDMSDSEAFTAEKEADVLRRSAALTEPQVAEVHSSSSLRKTAVAVLLILLGLI